MAQLANQGGRTADTTDATKDCKKIGEAVAKKIADSCNGGDFGNGTTIGSAGSSPTAALPVWGQPCSELLSGQDANGQWQAQIPEHPTPDACDVYQFEAANLSSSGSHSTGNYPSRGAATSTHNRTDDSRGNAIICVAGTCTHGEKTNRK